MFTQENQSTQLSARNLNPLTLQEYQQQCLRSIKSQLESTMAPQQNSYTVDKFPNIDSQYFHYLRNLKFIVDKSMLTKVILESSKKLICVSIPPGFGKSFIANLLTFLLQKNNSHQNDQQLNKVQTEFAQKMEICHDYNFLYKDFKKYYVIHIDMIEILDEAKKLQNQKQLLVITYLKIFNQFTHLQTDQKYKNMVQKLCEMEQVIRKKQLVTKLFYKYMPQNYVGLLCDLIQKNNSNSPVILIMENSDCIEFENQQSFKKISRELMRKSILQLFQIFMVSHVEEKMATTTLKSRKIILFNTINNLNFKQASFSIEFLPFWNKKIGGFLGVSDEEIKKTFKTKNIQNITKSKIKFQSVFSTTILQYNQEHKKIFHRIRHNFQQVIQAQHIQKNVNMEYLIPENLSNFIFHNFNINKHKFQLVELLLKLSNEYESEYVQVEISKEELEAPFLFGKQENIKEILVKTLVYFGLLSPVFSEKKVFVFITNKFSFYNLSKIALNLWFEQSNFKHAVGYIDIENFQNSTTRFQKIMRSVPQFMPSENQAHFHHLYYVIYGVSLARTHIILTEQSMTQCGRCDLLFIPIEGESKRGIVIELKFNSDVVTLKSNQKFISKVKDSTWGQVACGKYIEILLDRQKKQSIQQVDLRCVEISKVRKDSNTTFEIAKQNIVLSRKQAEKVSEQFQTTKLQDLLKLKNSPQKFEKILTQLKCKSFKQIFEKAKALRIRDPIRKQQAHDDVRKRTKLF